jgi:hypothetical protein
VVSASVTVSRGLNTPNPARDVAYDPVQNLYGPAYKGNGLFIPPGVRPDDYPADQPLPFDDPYRPMPEKDAVMLVQHVKHHAAELGLDPERVAVAGTSAAAITVMWVALGPDRRDTWAWNPVASGQDLEPTDVAAAIFDEGAVYFAHYRMTAKGVHFPDTRSAAPGLVSATGSAGLAAGGATAAPLGNLYDVPAKTLRDTEPTWLLGASAMVYGDGGDGLAQANAVLPAYWVYESPSSIDGPLVFDIDDPDYEPFLESDLHSAWNGHTWKQRFPYARLVTTDDAAYDIWGDLWDGQQHGGHAVADEVVPDLAVVDQVNWLAAELNESWRSLGAALKGVMGQPVFRGSGRLREGGWVSLKLERARPYAGALLFFGGGEVTPVPLVGGTLLLPQFWSLREVVVGAEGEAELAFSWPAGIPAGIDFHGQWAVADPSAPFGVSLSNAMTAVTE